jgi:hypothetical protein
VAQLDFGPRPVIF